jgi:hypothetical protein
MHAISTHRLWAMTLHRTSFTCPVSDFDRSESPNFRLIMENVDSTLLRQRCGHEWYPRQDRPPKVCPNPKCKSPYWDTPRRVPKGA